MNNELRKVAIRYLEELRSRLKANSITCHFRNPYSGYFWLFHRSGVFKYPCQMYGPLTHPDQNARMSAVVSKENKKLGMAYFKQIPEQLSANVLGGVSFVKREGIKHCIRIRLKDAAQRGGGDSTAVVIFLNYTRGTFPSESEARELIGMMLPMMSEGLLTLVNQPRLEEPDAWRLRSVMLNFKRELGDVLVTKSAEKGSLLYRIIVQQALDLIRPNGKASNVVCSLSQVSADEEIKVLDIWPPNVRSQAKQSWRGGIVDYVGRTGQTYMVENVDAYRRLPTAVSRPAYLNLNENTRCELACPLIVQGKVVGVLNIEADQASAYDDRHALMLFYFASSAALAVRQETLWLDLRTATAQQHSITHAANEKDIFDQTLEAAENLGYGALIWDLKRLKWHPRTLKSRHRMMSEQHPRSVDGFTKLVHDSKSAVAVADLRKGDDGEADFDPYEAELDQSGLFTSWQPLRKSDAPARLNPQLEEMVRRATTGSPQDVVTCLGFPIFKLETANGKLSLGEVRAVLWVKCQRHFLSLLDDDSWCLSLLCRNASAALKVLEDTNNRIELLGDAKKFMLRHHFGRRSGAILKSLNKASKALSLSAKEGLDIIVLNIDMRGSTELAQKLAERRQPELYVKLVRTYYNRAHEIVLKHDGVFDKTMGDGIHALFNVYRKGILPIMPSRADPKEAAVQCAFEVFDEFAELVGQQRQEWHIVPDFLCLGAALTIGDGYIGSFWDERHGIDYTVLGDVANRAGKLVARARAEELSGALDRWRKKKAHEYLLRINSKGKREPFVDPDVSALIKRLKKKPPVSVLMADNEFEEIASREDYEGYVIGEDRQLFLLRADKPSGAPPRPLRVNKGSAAAGRTVRR